MQNPDKVWEALEAQVKLEPNKYVDRLWLRRIIQRDGESDEFLKRCDAQAWRCKFPDTESEQMIIEQFMYRIQSNELQRQLIISEDIRLSKATDIARSHEATIGDNKDMIASVWNYSNVDAVGYQNFAKASKPCIRCGKLHSNNSSQSCPAYGAESSISGKVNHRKKRCLSIPENRKYMYKGKNLGQSQYAKNKSQRNYINDKSKKSMGSSWLSQDDPIDK